MNPVAWIKLKILRQVLDGFNTKEMADVIEAFGKKEFGEEKDKYLEQVVVKLASLIWDLNKRRHK